MSRATIRRLFLSPKPSYPLPSAAKLLATKPNDLRGWVAAGEVETVIAEGKEAIVWAEVAEAIPKLLRPTELELRIPRLEVLALEKVAMRDGRSVDTVLARELLDFVSAEAEWLGREIPGFLEALAWPDHGGGDQRNHRGI